ncbi:MAG: RluA family pseudouridine synthase [Thermoanaerobaculia bacterium]
MLDILYEDEALLFVNKPPDIVVQRGYDADEPILIDQAVAHAGPLFLMQRLDRGTSGVMFFSKLSSINANLTRQFERKAIRKRYLALSEGHLGERQVIDAPLARIGPISFGVRPSGKRAVTVVGPLAATACGSFLRIDLLTGRTHQIRAHLAAIGHPLIGDWLYGTRNDGRPMLHAVALTMTHPLTNQRLAVTAPIATDFLASAVAREIVSGSEDMMTLAENS